MRYRYNKGDGGLQGEREGDKVVVRLSELGYRECRGTTGPCKDKVKVGSQPGRWVVMGRV